MGGAVLQRLYADSLRHARCLAHEPHATEYTPGCIPSPFALFDRNRGRYTEAGSASPIFYSSRVSTWHKPLILFGVG